MPELCRECSTPGEGRSYSFSYVRASGRKHEPYELLHSGSAYICYACVKKHLDRRKNARLVFVILSLCLVIAGSQIDYMRAGVFCGLFGLCAVALSFRAKPIDRLEIYAGRIGKSSYAPASGYSIWSDSRTKEVFGEELVES